jgi:hypothetical protein
MDAAIPRTRKTIRRSQSRPIPSIIPVDISVICMMFERLFCARSQQLAERARLLRQIASFCYPEVNMMRQVTLARIN